MQDAGKLVDEHGMVLIGEGFELKSVLFERPVALFGSCHYQNCRLGAYTYIGSNADCNNVGIGRYCSIAGKLQVGLGSHTSQWFTTFPFTAASNPFSKVTSYASLDKSWTDCKQVYDWAPKRTRLGNDIWIGTNVLLPGSREISVGDGAIIGANAVVTKDVPPYCIVAGNPARVVRQRFSDGVIADMLETQWWDYDFPACFAAQNRLIDSKFVRNAEDFLRWWKNGGKELLQKYPLSEEWRRVTLVRKTARVEFLGKGGDAC